MSQEVFEMMMELNLNSIEAQLVLQCAPLLSGLKVSNLLTIPRENLEILKEVLKNSEISYEVLLEKESRISILLFKKDGLECYLSKKRVREFLKDRNYDTVLLQEILPLFRQRYQTYMQDKKTFPHEMGIFLGYPVEDVEGFVQNNGKNFLHTGYWKVYKNMQEKEALFSRFEAVKESMIHLISSGVGIRDIMAIYAAM